jgi:endoglucanase
LKEYLIRKNIRNAAYWCLNPNSRDTSGLFMDEAWSQVNWEKIKFMEELQPEPTRFVF